MKEFFCRWLYGAAWPLIKHNRAMMQRNFEEAKRRHEQQRAHQANT